MPTRPRQHILEDLAHAALRREFSKAGWTIEKLSEDYGEDFLVRVFEEGHATPFSIYLQSKATDHIERYKSKDLANISYPIETGHLKHWERFWEPVILTVYDAATGSTYWRVIQPWIESLTTSRRNSLSCQSTSRVSIPVRNILDESGINRLSTYTEQRFNRFRREQDGANFLIECLKESIGLEIEYDAQNGILIVPNGTFQKGDGGAEFILFGKTGAMLSEIAENAGKTAQQALIDLIHNSHQEFSVMSQRERNKRKINTSLVDDA